VAHGLAAEAGRRTITLDDAEAALAMRAVRYGDDEHYDVLSAFIKSLRGSDPDAGLYWLARMLEAGEDPRLVARRLVILASEDIGMADPHALLVADAAARAVEFVGMPEARLNLAQAVIHLALSPKSNSVITGFEAAAADVRDQPAGAVPVHLRDASYPGARKLGHGKGYEYPHDAPAGWVPQEYRPGDVAGRTYYRPTAQGAEAGVGEVLERRRARARTQDAPDEGPGDGEDEGSR
jgi:putative ATPase